MARSFSSSILIPISSLSYYPISSLLSSILFVHSHTKCEDKRWDNEEKGKRWKGVWVPEPSFLSGSSSSHTPTGSSITLLLTHSVRLPGINRLMKPEREQRGGEGDGLLFAPLSHTIPFRFPHRFSLRRSYVYPFIHSFLSFILLSITFPCRVTIR